jgi:hypothetical protein
MIRPVNNARRNQPSWRIANELLQPITQGQVE